jgi:hypothetical protein
MTWAALLLPASASRNAEAGAAGASGGRVGSLVMPESAVDVDEGERHATSASADSANADPPMPLMLSLQRYDACSGIQASTLESYARGAVATAYELK